MRALLVPLAAALLCSALADGEADVTVVADSDAAAARAPTNAARSLPDGSLLVGYANWGQCDQKLVEAASDGVNVIIWFATDLATGPEVTFDRELPAARARAGALRSAVAPSTLLSLLQPAGGLHAPQELGVRGADGEADARARAEGGAPDQHRRMERTARSEKDPLQLL